MFDQLEIPHKFFQNWIVLRMLGIRDCVPLIDHGQRPMKRNTEVTWLYNNASQKHGRILANHTYVLKTLFGNDMPQITS